MKTSIALLSAALGLLLSVAGGAAEPRGPERSSLGSGERKEGKTSPVPKSYYVAPNGTGDGTLAKPGSLATAMAHTGWAEAIGGGDTVYLRGGVYENGTEVMQMQFSGTDGHPVTWRSHPNERAVIDHPIYFQTCDYHRFRGLEFRSSHKETRPEAIGFFDSTTGVNNEWINCIIHDVPGVWTGGSGGKLIRGCIIWYAGKHLRDHVVYPYTKEFSGNIVGWTSGNGIELGTEGIQIRSNIMWGGGTTVRETTREILLVHPGVVANNCLFGTSGRQVAIHIHGGGDLVVTNNISCADTPLNVGGPFATATVTGNTLFSPQIVFARNDKSGRWTVNGNGYYSTREVRIMESGEQLGFDAWKKANPGYDAKSTAGSMKTPPDSATVFPNADEPKRAHIAIYNWTKAPHVTVDVSGVLAAGDRYALYSAQNLLAGPVATGIMSGKTIRVSMMDLTVAPILYGPKLTQPKPTSPEFGAFVLIGVPAARTGLPLKP